MSNDFFKFKQFTIFHGKCAMKVGTDGVLIGAWTRVDNARTILDVGCGTGLISIMCAQRCPGASITGIDIEESAVIQALENVHNTLWNDRIIIEKKDFSLLNENNKYDVIVSNPPYFKESLKSPSLKRSIARSYGSLDFRILISKSADMLSEKGRLSFIIPYDYYDDIIEEAIKNGLFLHRVTRVCPLPGTSPKRVMIEIGREQESTEYQDITIEKSRHDYTDEYKSLTKDFYLNL